MPNSSSFYRRNLPHWQPPGSIFFVTFGLHGSLPHEAQIRLNEAAKKLKKMMAELQVDSPELSIAWKKLFKYADEELDKSPKALYLKEPSAAESIIAAIFKEQDKRTIVLHRFCIMPNHVHLLIEPLPENTQLAPEQITANWPPLFYTEAGRRLLSTDRDPENLEWPRLWTIMKSIKGSTAHKIGSTAGVSGKIWLPESWDHWIRNEGEYFRVIEYIDNNPVKAGLCGKPENWIWSTSGWPSATVAE